MAPSSLVSILAASFSVFLPSHGFVVITPTSSSTSRCGSDGSSTSTMKRYYDGRDKIRICTLAASTAAADGGGAADVAKSSKKIGSDFQPVDPL